MADSTTTTPADTTHVSSVGEIAAGSDDEAWRDFLAGLLRRDLEGEDLRLARWRSLVMRSVAGDGELEVVDVEARRRVGLKVGSWMVAVGCCCCMYWTRVGRGVLVTGGERWMECPDV